MYITSEFVGFYKYNKRKYPLLDVSEANPLTATLG